IQVKKLSSSGEELWLRNYNTPENLGDFPFGLFIDKTGDIYIAVRSEDSLRYSKGSVIKFSKNGDLEWEYFFDELDYEYSVFRPFYIDENLNLYLNGSFSDSNSGSNIFIMKLSQKNNTGINEPLSISRSYSLLQNYPNPFNPYTDINFSLPVSSFIKLTINDITGQQIKSLINEEKRSGNYSVKWDGKDDSGRLVSSGVYFYRIQANDFIMVKKMILLR
ncbi:MAG: FlgD immunoglobulin-like domain containing protein, partial [Ignavibacteria bacterium]